MPDDPADVPVTALGDEELGRIRKWPKVVSETPNGDVSRLLARLDAETARADRAEALVQQARDWAAKGCFGCDDTDQFHCNLKAFPIPEWMDPTVTPLTDARLAEIRERNDDRERGIAEWRKGPPLNGTMAHGAMMFTIGALKQADAFVTELVAAHDALTKRVVELEAQLRGPQFHYPGATGEAMVSE